MRSNCGIAGPVRSSAGLDALVKNSSSMQVLQPLQCNTAALRRKKVVIHGDKICTVGLQQLAETAGYSATHHPSLDDPLAKGNSCWWLLQQRCLLDAVVVAGYHMKMCN